MTWPSTELTAEADWKGKTEDKTESELERNQCGRI